MINKIRFSITFFILIISAGLNAQQKNESIKEQNSEQIKKRNISKNNEKIERKELKGNSTFKISNEEKAIRREEEREEMIKQILNN